MEIETKSDDSDIKKNEETIEEESTPLNETQILLREVVDDIDRNYRNKQENWMISSGFKKLDNLLQGFREGDLNIIASRPSIGKTTFALSIFLNLISNGVSALYISFEKNEKELLKDIVSIHSHFDTTRLESGFFHPYDFDPLFKTFEFIHNKSAFYLKSFYNTTLPILSDYIKKQISENFVKIVFIDYLTMIIPAPTYATRWEQVSEISRSLKSMAMEYKVPFIVLCPIHRNITDLSPKISDLSESGSIEYEADRIILLYKDDKKQKDFTADRESVITVYTAKNRRGPIGTFDLDFNHRNKTFTDTEERI